MFIYKFMSGIAETVGGDEDEEEGTYDPHVHRKVEKPTTYADTMIHMLKGSIGAGILAMPDAIQKVGLIAGVVGIIIIGVFATYCIQLLIAGQYEICKRKKVGYMSYPKTMGVATDEGPPWFRWTSKCLPIFVNSVLIFWQLGLCSVYAVFVAENIKLVVDFYGNVYSIRIHLLFLLLPLLISNLVKDLKLLTPISTISNLVTLLGLLLVFFYLIEDDVKMDNQKLKIKKYEDVPVFVGTTLFALEAVGVILALEYNMERPRRFVGIFGLFNIGMLIILSLYMLVGVFGYLKYGEDIKASITLNLPYEQKKAQAARIVFALAIFLTCPLQNFVAYSISWHKLQKHTDPAYHSLYDYLLRIILILAPWLVAMAVPKLGPVISLIGALCLSLLALILPAVMDACIWYPDKYGVLYYKLLRDIFIMVVGFLCLISGVYTSIIEITHQG